MDAAKRLKTALKKHFGVKGDHLVIVPAGEGVIARVGQLHFRCPPLGDGPLEVWNGQHWRDVRNLRELGFALSETAGLSEPPELRTSGPS
ncbi:hypothetical protein [Deinococcus ruber]|uniref:Uncharacterized protein n=1 Tax=Deinococcus ruber TaxID=1848197 RepID=A0A918CDU7_9DEIO|nr:hypothetical protein [Deinococcus ruber]GGR17973.1 hypothetical protein GCM10008957_33420 [Deinococcus ruber]